MKKYSGFTLIEMLIVMGIIIILMAAGIVGGRFALQRANRIQKISAAENIEQALWGSYSDKRNFPYTPAGNGMTITPAVLMSTHLEDYADAGQFDGGADGTFWYVYGDEGQIYVVCTSLGGINDEGEVGIFCTGNGLDKIAPYSTAPAADNIWDKDHPQYGAVKAVVSKSNWYGETRSWTAP